MKYDCGALRAHPRQSSTFRLMYDRISPYSRTQAWPVEIQQEACAFFHTPGIAESWLAHVFNYGTHTNIQYVKASLAGRWPEWVGKSQENLITATYDDAVWYLHHAPHRTIALPLWGVPFMMEDVKRKIPHKELQKIWGSRFNRKRDFLNFGV